MTDARSPPSRWLVSIAVMLTTIMVILDMTIVNVAMPHMMGALGATSDQITWVLTSYIAATAMFIPLTGYLSRRFGRKRLMLASIAGFAVASALCGQARTLAEIVVFRTIQGVAGAAVIPLSQSVMVGAFPAEERGRGMAFWGIGIMLGPVLGPTLGGYLTDHLNWRWVFYINIPIGILSLAMVAALVAETKTARERVDWLGAVLMMAGIATLQIVLDRGNQENWFSSSLIAVLALVSVLALMFFAIRSWQRQDTVVRLKLLRDRNLAMASLIMAVFGLGLFGTIALQPILLERLLGYPAETAGIVMAPRGIGTALSMLLVSRLIARYDPRLLMLAGLLLAAGATHVMTWYNLDISPDWVVWPGFVQGLGMGMIFVPLTTLAYETVAPAEVDHASGIFNLFRTVGSSAGISILTTVLTRAEQFHWNQLGGHLNPFNPALHEWLAARGTTLNDPAAVQILGLELTRHSSMLAFIDAFRLVTLSFLLLAPLVFLIKRPSSQATQAGASV
jgi:DHA2 family multidrug resistance protein